MNVISLLAMLLLIHLIDVLPVDLMSVQALYDIRRIMALHFLILKIENN